MLISTLAQDITTIDPLVESASIKQLLAEHFGLSPIEQDDALLRFSNARLERARGLADLPPETVNRESTSIEWIEGEWDLP